MPPDNLIKDDDISVMFKISYNFTYPAKTANSDRDNNHTELIIMI
jgi:hypothetical protein